MASPPVLPRVDRRYPGHRMAELLALLLAAAGSAGVLAGAGPAVIAPTVAGLAVAGLGRRHRRRARAAAERALAEIAGHTAFGRGRNLTGWIDGRRGLLISPTRGELALYRRGQFEILNARFAWLTQRGERRRLKLLSTRLGLPDGPVGQEYAQQIEAAIRRARHPAQPPAPTAPAQAAPVPAPRRRPGRRAVVMTMARRLRHHPAVAGGPAG